MPREQRAAHWHARCSVTSEGRSTLAKGVCGDSRWEPSRKPPCASETVRAITPVGMPQISFEEGSCPGSS